LAVVFNLFTGVVFLNAERAILELHHERSAQAEMERLLQAQAPEAIGNLASHTTRFSWRELPAGAWSGHTAHPWSVQAKGERDVQHAYRWYGRSPTTLQIAGETDSIAWRAEVPLDDTAAVLDNTARLLTLYLLLNTIVLLAVGMLWLSRTVVKPLDGLVEAIRQIRDPREFTPIAVRRTDEIGILAAAFNDFMARIGQAEARNRAYVIQVEDAYRRLEEAQARVITSAKLASLGRLSAGIAHEVGNPLSAVIGYLRLLPMIEDDGERAQIIERAVKESMRIDHIIRGLLSLAHQPHEGDLPEPAEAFLEELIATIQAQPSFREIRLESALDIPDIAIYTAGGALQQVIVNLCVNAADAMGGSGRVHITAVSAGPNLRVSIEDEGPGIPAADLPYIFDPFFTTKPVGEGTGIGLSICHQIVTALNGSITAEQGERGARFVLELPIAAPAPSRMPVEEPVS
jgi:two-component system, NtrC family, sensor kinase